MWTLWPLLMKLFKCPHHTNLLNQQKYHSSHCIMASTKENNFGIFFFFFFFIISFQPSRGSQAYKPMRWPSIKAQWWFLLFCSPLTAIYRLDSSRSMVVLICFQSSSSGPFLKSKIDMFSAAVPPPQCSSSVWDWSQSIAETCSLSCCAA